MIVGEIIKILIIARGYPTEKYKRNGIFEFDQAKALVEYGHEVIYAAIDVRSFRRWRKWGYESFLKEKVQVEAMNIPCGRIPKKILHKISEFALKNLYNRIINKYGKPDIIHSHFIETGYITIKVFKNLGIPLVHTEHYSGMNKENLSKYYYNLGLDTYKYLNEIMTVSKHLADSIRVNFGISSKVIPNIVDTSSFNYKKASNANKAFTFISVGNLLINKRMDLLISSFYDAFKNNTSIKLYIYGEGPERRKLERLIDNLNLQEQVFLMGLQDRKVIAKKMQESQCFVLASRLETFGVVYIEAMAAGLPVIATQCGGPEDFVNESNGILVSVNNQEELTKTLLKMYNDVNRYDKKAISERAIEQFSSSNIATLLTKEYTKLVE